MVYGLVLPSCFILLCSLPEEIDLLNAKIVVEATIRNYKDYTTGDMSALIYTTIEKAYADRQDQLQKALGVTVCPV